MASTVMEVLPGLKMSHGSNLAIPIGVTSGSTARVTCNASSSSGRKVFSSALQWQQTEVAKPETKEVPSRESVQDGKSTKVWTSQEVMKTESEVMLQTYARADVVFESGHGSWLIDVDGKEYLDFTAGIAVNALGHGDEVWVKAVAAQASKLTHVSNLYYSLPSVQLAERLVKCSFADRIFFVNSGTEANEAAIKFARKFQRVFSESQNPGNPVQSDAVKTEFVAFNHAFHGRTMGALALTSKVQYRTPFEPLMPGVNFVDFGDLGAVAEIVKTRGIAAIFVEPVQGEGGVYPAAVSFLQGLRKLCDETGTLLVFDEIQCGLGRAGTLFAYEAYGVKPDILTVAKPIAGGLPMGAVLMTQAVASSIAYGDHGSTFAGNPLVCAGALAVLDRLQEPGFLEGVAAKGSALRSKLSEKLIGKNSHVKEVRGAGLLIGIQLDVSASPVVAAAREAGLLVITAGKGDVVRLAPPLTVSEKELELGIDILVGCLNRL